MHCLKCGREVPEGQTFCRDCLGIMEDRPVSQDMPLVLPRRENPTSRRIPGKKRVLSTEEKLAQTRQQLSHSRVLCVILSVLLVLLLSFTVFLMVKFRQPAVGQNYRTPSTATTAGPLPTN